ncbi:FAD-binding oxidoreductase [Peribacillus sp. TH16]|uniref:FAD-binding oxidoreductase n=1 Tax=Peribacillus sp. TH16 TaxID=2798482 RepID=UPI0019147EAD|nr:FAD-binding oxidoreductase [Peribacillus sp. TH16]MBK5480359.1 FAD-binding oxidoreductase [Peribacillus sp. TH16]
MEKEVLAEISQIIPSDRIFNDLSERYCYSYDASFGEYLPEIVIQPKNANEISKLVKLANIHIKAEEVGLFYPPDPSSSNVATAITVNPGCQMQMSIGIQREGAAKRIKSMHLVEILAEACGLH